MEWMDHLNSIMEYVEGHLDGELDTDEISRLAACPFAMFQRVFTVITGITFTEYVRSRKLMRALRDLQRTDDRIIDIALRCGYESPDAFTVAFRRAMGVSPSQLRRENASAAYHPPLRFKLRITGVTNMAEIIKTYSQDMPRTRFIGRKYGDEDRVDGMFTALWEMWLRDGMFAKIESTPGFDGGFFEDSDAYIGLMRLRNGEPFEYWIGMFAPEGMAVPDGFDYIDISEKKLGVCWIRGKESDVYGKDDLVMEAFQKNGIAPVTDENGAFWFFERYTVSRFVTPDENGLITLDHGYFVAD